MRDAVDRFIRSLVYHLVLRANESESMPSRGRRPSREIVGCRGNGCLQSARDGFGKWTPPIGYRETFPDHGVDMPRLARPFATTVIVFLCLGAGAPFAVAKTMID